MTAMPQKSLSLEQVKAILLRLDSDDPISAKTLEACQRVGGPVTQVLRSMNPRFRNVKLQTPEEIEKYHNLITANKTCPISNYVDQLTLELNIKNEDNGRSAPIIYQKACEVLFQCTQAREVHVCGIQITSAPDSLLPVKSLALRHVAFDRNRGISDFLRTAPHLSELIVAHVRYGRLEASSPSLPSSIRSLKIVFDKEHEILPSRDYLLSWMAHYPEKMTDIETFECQEIGDSSAEDMVLVLSYLKPVLTALNVTIQYGSGLAQEIILAYVVTNQLPLRSFRGSHGEDLEAAIQNSQW